MEHYMKINSPSLSSVIRSSFVGIHKLKGTRKMLFIYLILQILLSGLASFVVPFFSSKIFSGRNFSLQSILIASFWLLFALLSVWADYSGNTFNLKTYYKIQEKTFLFHANRVLSRRYSALKNKEQEEIVSRLNDDTEISTSIALWTIGILAMLLSFIIVLSWSLTLSIPVFLLITLQSVISTETVRRINLKISELKDRRISAERKLQEYHFIINHDLSFLYDPHFKCLIDTKLNEEIHSISSIGQTENLLNSIKTIIEGTLELITELGCVLILFHYRIHDASLIIPIFTLHSSYQNQIKTLQDNISSIRQNAYAIDRLNDIENLDEYKCPIRARSDYAIEMEEFSVLSENGKRLLHNLNMKVRPGEKLAIIGLNGSGKTTLLRAICGLQKSTGVLKINKNVAYLPVTAQLFDGTLNSNCAFVRRLDNDPPFEEAYSALYERMKNFPSCLYEKDNVNNLSGGQKQIASFLRTMLYERDILLMDEPTRSLESKYINMFIAFIKSAPNTILFVTHDNDLLKCADRIIEIKKDADCGVISNENN